MSMEDNREIGFMRLPQVLAAIPVSKANWWAGVKSGLYPKSIKISKGITVWKISDIKEFIDQLSSQNN